MMHSYSLSQKFQARQVAMALVKEMSDEGIKQDLDMRLDCLIADGGEENHYWAGLGISYDTKERCYVEGVVGENKVMTIWVDGREMFHGRYAEKRMQDFANAILVERAAKISANWTRVAVKVLA